MRGGEPVSESQLRGFYRKKYYDTSAASTADFFSSCKLNFCRLRDAYVGQLYFLSVFLCISSGYIYSYEYIQPSFWLYIYLTFKASLSFFPTAITRDSSQVLVQTAMRCCPLRRLTTNPHTSETASDWGKQTKNETVDRRGRKTKKKKNGST